MKRRTALLATVFVGALACSFVSSTTFAYYRASIGPKRCCATHCRHAMPKRAAEQCCRSHPDAAPAATAKVAPPDMTPIACAVLAPVVTTFVGVSPSLIDGRAPPPRTLIAQHTSLAL